MYIFILDTVLCSLTIVFQHQNRHRRCLFLHLRVAFLTMQLCCNDRAPMQSMQYVFVLCQWSSPLIFVHSSFQWYVSAFLCFSITYSRVPLTSVCQPGLFERTFLPRVLLGRPLIGAGGASLNRAARWIWKDLTLPSFSSSVRPSFSVRSCAGIPLPSLSVRPRAGIPLPSLPVRPRAGIPLPSLSVRSRGGIPLTITLSPPSCGDPTTITLSPPSCGDPTTITLSPPSCGDPTTITLSPPSRGDPATITLSRLSCVDPTTTTLSPLSCGDPTTITLCPLSCGDPTTITFSPLSCGDHSANHLLLKPERC